MTKTLVIGAGMAGLTAARELVNAGQEVIVLEARARIGGRIFTRRDVVDGAPIEFGAEFLHGDKVPQWELVRQAGLNTLEWNKRTDSLIRTEGSGELVPMGTLRDTSPEFELTRTWNLPGVPPLEDDEDLYHYLIRIGFTKDQLQYTRRSFVNAVGEAIHHISAKEALMTMQDTSAGAGDYRILEGYDRILPLLADGLDIRLNTPVQTLQWERGSVEAHTPDGTVYRAARAVITVPTGVMLTGKMSFSPALPRDHQDALRNLSMGPGMKIIFVFDTPILPEGIGALYSAGSPSMWWSPTFGQPHAKQTAITAFATGDYARQLYAQGTENMPAAALKTLRAELGDLPEPRAVYVQDWTNDPFACGVYSVVRPGAVASRAQFAQPIEETLYWAGEATASNAWAATVHGAHQSGKRAAQEILARG